MRNRSKRRRQNPQWRNPDESPIRVPVPCFLIVLHPKTRQYNVKMGSPCKNCGKWKDAIPRPPPPPQLSFAVSGVYKSTDSAASWKPMDTGAVSKLEVHSLAVSANDIFAGTENGVWCQSLTATEPADNKNDCF